MKYKKRIRPNWDNILYVQEKLGRKLRREKKSYVDYVKMVTGELLENSLKYYMKHNIKKPITFTFNNSADTTISIKDQIIFDEDADVVIDHIDTINASVNPYNLFIERLQEILDNRIKGESRLGLLRIANDGGYGLSYVKMDNKISIYAKKSRIGENREMKSLEYGDLKIEVNVLDSHIKVSWIGKCRTLNPEHILDTYLLKLSRFAAGKRLVVAFDNLESMNSSTVPPLLTFIKTLEDNSTESLFLYDDSEDWQRASFKPLSVIAGGYKYVKIKAMSTHNMI